MSGTDADVARARARVEETKLRLALTARVLKHKVSPSTIAHNAWDGVRDRGEDVAGLAVSTARAHPVTLSVGAGAVALFLARKPAARLVGKLFPGRNATDQHDHGLSEGYDPRNPAAPLHGLVPIQEENAQ